MKELKDLANCTKEELLWWIDFHMDSIDDLWYEAEHYEAMFYHCYGIIKNEDKTKKLTQDDLDEIQMWEDASDGLYKWRKRKSDITKNHIEQMKKRDRKIKKEGGHIDRGNYDFIVKVKDKDKLDF